MAADSKTEKIPGHNPGPYAGGVRGGSDEPPFLAGYTYYPRDRTTLDDGLSSMDDGWRSSTARV